MRALVLFVGLISISSFNYAQRAELKSHCHELTDLLKSDKPFHIQYTVTVKGKGENAEQGSINMDFYKSSLGEDFVMGSMQEIIHKSNIEFLINHDQKAIVVKRDTTKSIAKNDMLNDLDQFVDSAVTVKSSKKNSYITYILEYPSSYIYQKVEFVFNSHTKKLVTIYAEFAKDYHEPYASMKVNYEVWDTSWKPDNTFPNIEKYLVLSGNSYQANNNYKNYKIHQ